MQCLLIVSLFFLIETNVFIFNISGLMEENINYYQEACKLYIANVVLTTQVEHFYFIQILIVKKKKKH